jgi:hypothetical protein
MERAPALRGRGPLWTKSSAQISELATDGDASTRNSALPTEPFGLAGDRSLGTVHRAIEAVCFGVRQSPLRITLQPRRNITN